MAKLGEKHSEKTKAKLRLAALLYWRRKRYKESLKKNAPRRDFHELRLKLGESVARDMMEHGRAEHPAESGGSSVL